jgi:lipoate-protein ligase B
VRGETSDVLVLLEHPPTITVGQSGDMSNLFVDRSELRQRGISFFLADRGGDITYHGPGQLVAYPIVDLRDRGRDVSQYVRDLEETVIRTLADLSIKSRRDERQPGVWVGDAKIASIGVAVRKWVTTHGIALNVSNDLGPFSLIRPCGLSGQEMTAVSGLVGRRVQMDEAIAAFVNRFAEVFSADIVEPTLDANAFETTRLERLATSARRSRGCN